MLTARSRWRAWVRRGALLIICSLGVGMLATAVAPSASAACVAYFSVAQRPAVGTQLTATFSHTYGTNPNGTDACAGLTPGWTDSVHPDWYTTRYSSGGTTKVRVKSGAQTLDNTYTPTASDAGYELWITTRPLSENIMTFVGVVAYTPTVTPAVTGSGPTAGGTWITMNGTGYDGILGATTDVTFGGVPGTGVNAYCTYYGCLGVYSPPHGAGTVDVNVVNAYSTTKVGTFTYYAAPTVTSATPSSGPASDRAWVTLTGTGFVGATSVSFGGTSVTSSEFVVDSDTSMRVYRPTHAAGTVSVVVTGPGGYNASNSVYTYYSVPPVVNSALTKSATVGTAMSTYTVSGTNTPTSYSATGLPAGLAINTSNGQITGTPTVAGTFDVTIGASNSAGGGTATLVMTIALGTQGALSLTSTSGTFASPITLVATGGSGTGALSYAVTSAGTAGCSLASATSLVSTSAGSCTVTATRAADSNYNAVSSSATTVSIGKASQAAVTLTSTAGTYGTALALASSGGSGVGAVTYSVTSSGTAGCSLASATSLTSTGAGTCTVTVTKALDSSYNAASSPATTVTFSARTQTSAVVLSSSGSKTFGSPLTLVASGGSGSGAIGYSVVDAGSAGCVVLGAQLSTTGDVGTTCTVKATRAADTNNLARDSDAQTITVAVKAAQPALSVVPPAITYGSPVTLATTGGAGSGEVTFAVTTAGSAGCSITAGELITTGDVGTTCGVTATKATSTNYLAVTSAERTVTVATQANQAALTLTSTAGTYGSDLALTSTGGSGTGVVIYAVTSSGTAGCSLASATSLTSTGAGTCTVTVTKASDINYIMGSSSATTVTLAARTQTSAVVMTSSATKVFGSTVTLVASGGSGSGSVGYGVVDGGTAGCAVMGDQLSTTGDVGTTCTVKATRAADANNLARDSDPQTITVAIKATQPALSLVPPVITYRRPVALTTTGGAGPGAVTYLVSTAGTAGCTVVAGELHTTGDVGTTCGIAAYKAESINYLQAASSEVTVTVTGKAAQSITFAAPADRDYTPLPFTAVATSDSDLTVGLASATPTICSASGLSVTTLLPGTCVLDADQAGDGNYLPATTVRRTFGITPATQAVTWDPIAQAVSTSSPLTMLPAVGADAGAITYSVTSPGPAHCAISDPNLPILTFDSPGSCTVRADAASTATHQAGSSVKVFVIAAPPVAATSSSANESASGVPAVVVIKVRSLDPITANGGLAPGAELTTVDGEVVAIRVEANAANTGLDVMGADWRLSVVVNGPDGSPTALATGGILTVAQGSRIDVTGSGFEGRAQVRIYLLEQSVHLGSLMTGHDGGLDGSVVAPTDAWIGRDTLQINGFTPDRKVRSLSLGVRVVAQSAPKPSSVGTRIYFGYKSAVLTSKAKRSLRSMIAQMPHAAAVGAQVTGVVRSKGATGADRALASRRVAAVVSFLRRSGVSGELRSSVRRVEVLDGYRDRRVEIAVRPAT